MAHHSSSWLQAWALRPTLAACLAASAVSSPWQGAQQAQNAQACSGACATEGPSTTLTALQGQHAGGAPAQWRSNANSAGADALLARHSMPSWAQAAAVLPSTRPGWPALPLTQQSASAVRPDASHVWRRGMASNRSRKKGSQRGPPMPTSIPVRHDASLQQRSGSLPAAAGGAGAGPAQPGAPPSSRADRLANMWSPDALQKRMRWYAAVMFIMGVPLLGWVLINHSIIEGGRDMLKSPHPLFQQTAARRLRFALFADMFAERMVALGIPELLLAAVHPEQDTVALQEVLRTLAMLLQHEVSRDALMRAGIVQRLDTAVSEGWLPRPLEEQAAGMVAVLHQDEAYSQRRQRQGDRQQAQQGAQKPKHSSQTVVGRALAAVHTVTNQQAKLAFRKLLSLVGQRTPPPLDPDEDATCTVVLVPRRSHGLSGLLKKKASKKHASSRPADSAAQISTHATSLVDVPLAALDAVWDRLDGDSKRAVRLTSRRFWSCARSLTASPALLLEGQQPWHAAFPALNKLRLQLDGVDERDVAALVDGSRGRLLHLHTLSADGALRGDAFRTLAHLLVATPSLTVLHLREHSFRSGRDQRALAGVLDALPGLAELDLASGRADAGAPLGSGVIQRIARLKDLRRLACNASQLCDDDAAAMLVPLARLQSLSVAIGDSDSNGLQQCGAALGQLTRLSQLELMSTGLGNAGASLMLGGLTGCLRELTLGSCPQLTADIMPQVAQLSLLEVLSVPFTLDAPSLRSLSRLPALRELLTARRVALDPLGHDRPLRRVTKLVAASLTTSGQPLAAAFPALETLHMLRCGDAVVYALADCPTLSTLSIAEAHHLSDEGFSGLRGIIAAGLSSLSIEDAPRVSDAAFQRVFDRPMPQLEQLSLARLPAITDDALLHVTASCRRLTDATLAQCGRLTDKSLCRLAHMERLAAVHVAACNQVTAAGVVAVAAAPAMQRLVIGGCPCVLHDRCHEHRASVRVEVDGHVV